MSNHATPADVTRKPWKIAFEEHYLTPSFQDNIPAGIKPTDVPRVYRELMEVDERRVAKMDAAGIEYAILSLNSPGIQAELTGVGAIARARLANDELKAVTARHARRLGGFAALPMQDPLAAADELERCVNELGFHGALINSFTNLGDDDTVAFLDEEQYFPFWERAQALDLPVYLHPRNPPLSQQLFYRDRPELLAATWAFLVETSTHALRLITSGLFDRYPKLQICLGHLGEALPFCIWRLTTVYQQKVPNSKLQKDIRGYLASNFHYTTSGFFDTAAMTNVMQQVGADRVLFSTDHPWMEMSAGAAWFDNAQLSDAVKLQVGRENAVKLFRLDL